MLGNFIPFLNSNDPRTTPHVLRVPRADSTGALNSGWIGITPPAGASVKIGIINHPLPNLPSNVKAKGYDPVTDQVSEWTGSRWVVIA